MAYTVEELQLDNVTVQRVVPRNGGARGAAALREIAAATASQAEPVAAEPPAGVPVVDPDCVAPSNEQVDTIRKLYKARGVTGQPVLDDIASFLQREEKLTSLHGMSYGEATLVIDHLTKPVEE